MDKRFVKNNFGLLAVVSVCSVIAAGLLIFTLIEYVQMYDYISKIEDFRKQVEKIIKQKPAPVDGNRELLQQDIDLYSKVAKELQQFFGHPMQPALDAFFATLRTRKNAFGDDTPAQLTPERFLEEFHKGWDGIDQRDFAQKQYFLNNEFRPRFSNWAEAQREFIKAAQPVMFEPLSADNADEVLLSNLGIPRLLNGDPERLMRLLGVIRDRVLRDVGDKLQLSAVASGLGLMSGSGNEQSEGSANFKPEEFPLVLEHAEIIGDLLKRIKDTGIRTVYDIRVRTGAAESGGNEGGEAKAAGGLQEGVETAGSFRLYHYQLEVSGSMEAIRKMAASLDNAFADRRVYVVKSIFLYAEENGAAALFVADDDKSMVPGAERKPEQRRPDTRQVRRRRSRNEDDAGDEDNGGADKDFERRRRIEEAIRRYKEQQERLPYERRDGYGEILVGQGETYRAVIDVEYVAQAGR